MKKTTAPTTPEFQVTKEVEAICKNVTLDGVKTLHALKITSTFEVKRQFDIETNKPIKVVSRKRIDRSDERVSFDLKKVTPEELETYRKNKIPSFVLKIDGNLYHAIIHVNTSMMSSNILEIHQCANAGYDCSRLSAAPDNKGGCAKVRNRSRHIEKYAWITTGYETFNTIDDSFVVANCLHYEPISIKKKSSSEPKPAKL